MRHNLHNNDFKEGKKISFLSTLNTREHFERDLCKSKTKQNKTCAKIRGSRVGRFSTKQKNKTILRTCSGMFYRRTDRTNFVWRNDRDSTRHSSYTSGVHIPLLFIGRSSLFGERSQSSRPGVSKHGLFQGVDRIIV